MQATAAGNVWVTCLDCRQEFSARVHVESGFDSNGQAVARVHIDTEGMGQRFAAHVAAAPQSHPTYVENTGALENR